MDSTASPFHRFLAEASVHLEEARDADKALKRAVKIAREAFDADEACLAVWRPHHEKARVYAASPSGGDWRTEPFAAFLRGERPRLSPHVLFAPVPRRERPWGVLALRNAGDAFERSALTDAQRVGASLSRIVRRIDRIRLAEVRARIDRKMMEQLQPLDLFYQVLHGLRTLTRYDHSAAVLIREPDSSCFEVVAEQIAWRKGKSRRISSTISADAGAMAALAGSDVLGFDDEDGAWLPWSTRRSVDSLAELVAGADTERRARSVLIAPLNVRDELLGFLTVASCHPRSLGSFEAGLVQRFLPAAAVAFRNMDRATTLEAGMLEAERRNALATLARGVSHDVNNAFGSVLPLVQQLLSDARAGTLDRDLLVSDLVRIEASLQVCRRIFGGMLSFAQNERRTVGEGDLPRAVDGMRAVLERNMERRGIALTIEVPTDLPLVGMSQSDLEQLILNLASNACDAMQGGGRLTLRAQQEDGTVKVLVRDTGCGIPPENMARVREPFFTTKEKGNGLGLSICRSILWRARAEMEIESHAGEETRVVLRLPVARAFRSRSGDAAPSTGPPQSAGPTEIRE